VTYSVIVGMSERLMTLPSSPASPPSNPPRSPSSSFATAVEVGRSVSDVSVGFGTAVGKEENGEAGVEEGDSTGESVES